ncbi:MAG: type II toxin-antitoxin system RelB/DinJ family antitoxin [Proteobacteria bacterium]|nr:type II toxin-antitoxin system RelB/DinJ family antitoxin [Pseudomonadota bacterium]MCL2307597.1 type II toxin-antitoxin system RelB/DinJ family antitoxin [Pseudomonadota bacterium]
MSKSVNLSVRVNRELKEDAETLFGELGITLTAALNIFLRQAVRQRGIPFPVQIDPFHGERNLAHLRRAAADMDAGRNVATHELIEMSE